MRLQMYVIHAQSPVFYNYNNFCLSHALSSTARRCCIDFMVSIATVRRNTIYPYRPVTC